MNFRRKKKQQQLKKMGTFEKLEASTKCERWPKPRSGHRMCADENSLYVFGGYNPTYKTFNELWKYNTSTRNWLLLPDTERLAPATCASSSMVILNNNIFVFGGTGHPFARKNSNKLFMYSLKMRRWFDLSLEKSFLSGLQMFQKYPRGHVKVKLCGCRNLYDVGPLPKYGQAMDYIFEKIYIHSGTQGEDFLNELHRFCLKTFRWIKYELCSNHNRHAPIPRYRHEMIATKERLYVLGGATPFTTFDFNHIETFDLTEKSWKKLTYPSDVKMDELPVGRKAHSCAQWDGKIYMSAGFNVDDGVLNDLWTFDVKARRWNRLKHLEFSYPVQFHSSAVTTQGCLYIYGGVTNKGKRVDDLHELWLKVPSLQRQAWMKVVGELRKTNNLRREVLSQLRVPKHFIDYIDESMDVVAA